MLGIALLAVSFAQPLAEFANYHRQITGRDPAEGALRLAVDPSVSRTGNDAYSIRSDARGAVVTGSNLRSVWYGVYDLLERRGGCRWFWDGDVVPRREAIDLGGLDIREESRFEYRAIRYFAHRGLTRFQAEHWGLEDWKREIDWCLKRRLNCFMPRIGMEDTWQKTFPDIVPYPDPRKNLRANGKGYDNRDLFWSLQYRGELRKAFTDYAFGRGLMIPTDFGTMTHWYSRTPQEFLDAKKPPFLPQATSGYGEKTGLVWDIFQGEWLSDYWRLTQSFIDAGYGTGDLLHTIGLGERLCFRDRAKNLQMKIDVMKKLFALANEKCPNSKILLAGWDFYSAWNAAEVRSLLPHLDPEKVLILDYEGDAVEGWDYEFQCLKGNFTHWDVIGKYPYTFGIFLAYENALDIRANYPLIEARQKLIENDPMCKGYILWPESSHTDIFALRYFTANAWKGGRTSAELLPEFCRDRYGAQAATLENIWRKAIECAPLYDWWGNYGMWLAGSALDEQEDNLWQHPVTDWLIALKDVEASFAALAKVRWSDDFVRRDSMDLARTLLDRRIEAKRLQLVQAYGDWTKKKVRDAEIVRGLASDYVRLVSAMTRLLALHTDYSLADSLDRLNAAHPVENPDFGHVLVDNAVNGYCRSHQYEAAAFLYEPFAKDCAAAVTTKLDAGDRTAIDGKALKAKGEAYREAMLKRPLVEMRSTAPRTEAAFVALMEELAK